MLTALSIQKLVPREKEYTVSDGGGLYLRVKPNGLKIWVVKVTVSTGKRLTKTIGNYPQLSVAAARNILNKIVEANTKDVDHPDTFEAIYNDWLAFKKSQIKETSHLESAFKRVFLPKFGPLPFEMVTAPMVIEVLKDYCKKSKLETVKKYAGWIKQLEIYAVNYGYIVIPKLQGINKVFPQPKVINRPSIPPSELPAFFAKIKVEAATSPLMLDALLIGFYTLLRPGEYCRLRWDWIKDDVIYVPAEVMKMKRPHRVPITPQLQAVLDRRLKISEYVLFSPRVINKPIKTDAVEKFLREHGFRDILVPHGIRAIGRTWMSENKVPFATAELCLAHSVGSATVQAYDRADMLDERKEVMAKWCAFVESCVKG